MSCAKTRRQLSAYIDGALSAMERLQVEDHLGSCRGCRRHHRQMEHTVGMVRRLEPMEAPRFSLHRVRPGATSRADRRARWEQIRARSLAPPRPMLRPIAFAALALMLVVAVLQSLDRVVPPPGDEQAAPGTEVTRVPTERPGIPPEERPEWLRREIARRVAQAREEEQTQEPATPPALEPARIAELQPTRATGQPGGEGPLVDGGRPEPDPGAAPAPATTLVARLDPGLDPADEPEAAEPLPGPAPAGRRPARPSGDPGGEAPTTETGRVVTGFVVGQPQPLAADEPGAASTGPAAPARPSRTGVRSAPEPAEDAPVEIAEAYHTVAVLGPEASESLSFLDPDEHAAALESGDLAARMDPAREAGSITAPREPEPLPEPDPDTGVTPPVMLDRPGRELGVHAAKLRERGLVAPLGLSVTVGAAGEVADVDVVETTGLAWLDEVLVEAVRAWSFRPAEDAGGRPVAANVELVVDFDLDVPRL